MTLPPAEGLLLPDLPVPTQVEIEFTNRCNAQCVACPRADMPQYGRLSQDTLARILDLYRDDENPLTGAPVELVVAGGGEPLLHPQAPAFLEMCRNAGFKTTLITNASRLHAIDLERVVGNVDQILVSFWGIEPVEYQRAMKLDHTTSLRNVERAIEVAGRLGVPLAVQWLHNAHLRSDEASIRNFWRERGVLDVRGGSVMWNRGSAIKDIDVLLDQSESIPPEFSRRVWCADLYFSDCYAWNGDLVLCCCDFFSAQRQPVGHVNALSRESIAALKRSLLSTPPYARCADCRLPRRQRAQQLAKDVLVRLAPSERRMVAYQ